MDDKGNKFFIIMFKDTKLPEYINKVQCVPHLWVMPSEESGYVKVSYPSCNLEIDLVFKKVDDFPSVNWSFYKATILHASRTKSDATEKLTLLHEIQSQSKNPEYEDETDENESDKKTIKLKDILSNSNHMNFTAPGPNIVELMIDTGVYVQNIRVNYIEKLKEPKQAVVILLKAIFTEDSLETLGIEQLNQKGMIVLYLYMLLKYGTNMEETRDVVIKFLKMNKRQNSIKKPRYS